jgi:hypothetical protein
MLGLSARGLYLREPLNQTKLQVDGGSTVFIIQNGHEDSVPSTYRMAADDAFRAVPRFSAQIVRDPNQWRVGRLTYRSHVLKGRCIIKDVNPLALRWLCDRYRFKLVYLTRHPAAVAASWHRMGWTEGIETRLPTILGPERYNELQDAHKQSFWSRHGAMQAPVHRYVFDTLDTLPDEAYTVVSYESLCTEPETTFEALFRFADFPFDTTTRERVRNHSTKAANRTAQPFSTQRNSESMSEKWKVDLSESATEELKQSFLSFKPLLYRASSW